MQGEWDMRHDFSEGTLTLGGTEIPTKTGYIKTGELKFYPQNPRLYSIVCVGDEEPSQAEIQKKLIAMEHVKQLVQSIRANGGLTDPLIVRDGDLVVLEGNSRLAAYRALASNDPLKWGQVKCTLLPEDISDGQIFALLGEYHIIGKKDWAPYEQAGYLYRRHKYHAVSSDCMAQEMGLSAKMVRHLIEVYDFMVTHHDEDVSRWSYYDEFLKNRAIKQSRKVLPELDTAFVEKVKSGEISKAVDVRDKVTKIVAVGGKVLTTFISGKSSVEHCYDRAVARGANNAWLKRLEKFHQQLAQDDTVEDFEAMDESHRKKCLFEMKKIDRILYSLMEKIK